METIVGPLIITFVLPLLGSIVMGIFAGLITRAYWPQAGPLGVGSAVAFIIFGAQLILRIDIERLEKLTGLDLNKDGFVGGGSALTDADKVLAGAKAGRPLSEESWVPRPFTRKRYQRARNELLKDGLIVWKNKRSHAQGLALRQIEITNGALGNRKTTYVDA